MSQDTALAPAEKYKNASQLGDTISTKGGFYPWIIWGLAASYFFTEYFARVAPSIMVPELMRDFQVNALALGSLSAFFYYAYVGMQVPVGVLVDRYGPHRLLTVMAVVCASGCVFFAWSQNLLLAEIGRFLMGFGASFAFIGSLKLASVWFPPSRFGLLSGLTQALGMLGAGVSEASMSYTVATIGWRNTMLVVAGVLLGVALLIGLFVRDRPAGQTYSNAHLATGNDLFAGLKAVLANPQSWYNAAFAGFVYAPTAAFAELWGVSFLVQAYGMSTHMAASAIGMIFIGWGVGGPIMGWISDRILRRRPIMLLSAALGFILITCVLYIPDLPTSVIFFLLFIYGISNTGVATAYAVSAEINPRSVAGTSLSFANMASVLVGAAFQPLIGWFLDLHWSGKIQDGVRVYATSDYRNALIVLPACLIIGFIFAILVRETYCRAKD